MFASAFAILAAMWNWMTQVIFGTPPTKSSPFSSNALKRNPANQPRTRYALLPKRIFCPNYGIPTVIHLEGNIGSGKSTIMNNIAKKYPHVPCVPEPIDEWLGEISGINLLMSMYEDKMQHGATFQHYAMQTLVKREPEYQPGYCYLLERSINSSINCFARQMIHDKQINKEQSHVLKDAYELYLSMIHPGTFRVFILVDITPETALKRICTRNRNEEDTIGLNLLKELHEFHHDWFKKWSRKRAGIQMLMVSGMQSEEDVQSDVENILKKFMHPNQF